MAHIPARTPAKKKWSLVRNADLDDLEDELDKKSQIASEFKDVATAYMGVRDDFEAERAVKEDAWKRNTRLENVNKLLKENATRERKRAGGYKARAEAAEARADAAEARIKEVEAENEALEARNQALKNANVVLIAEARKYSRLRDEAAEVQKRKHDEMEREADEGEDTSWVGLGLGFRGKEVGSFGVSPQAKKRRGGTKQRYVIAFEVIMIVH